MNQTYRQRNALVGRGIGKEAQMQALIAQQKNNKRTVIDPDRIDTERVMELTRWLTEDTDLGMIVRPLPYADIEGDTEATLNLVMQALGLYTFPTVELTDWLRQEIDDDPELEPHSAIEICAGTGWIGRTLGIPTTDAQDVSVWGGLTFASEKSECQWDIACIEVIGDGSFDDIPQDWWVFGFDTMHYNDGPHHDRDWCIRETKQLQEQLDAIKAKPEN